MPRTVIPLLVAIMAFVGCSGPSASEGDASPPEQAPTISRCFLQVTTGEPMVVDRDTLKGPVDSLVVHLDITGELVNGRYDWLPQEKDHMTGSITGHLENGLVTALYTYQAEGTTGKMEVLFRLEDDGLRIGTGDMVEAQGYSVFRDPSKAIFGPLVPPVDCP